MKPDHWIASFALPLILLATESPAADTPNLDRLVREGMTFTRTVCPFPLCVPSRAEILTGTSAFENGVPFEDGRVQRGPGRNTA